MICASHSCELILLFLSSQNFADLILRFLETPLFDVLLLLLLVRLLFPTLFGVKSKSKARAEKERTIVHQASSARENQFKKEDGEYIDYEEIK